ncbi:MAG: diguanylate cyclase, partial [Dokdonella sp.]
MCATLLLLTWLLPASGAGSAEQRYFFEPVESAASATQHTIRSLTQDRDGFVWLGTDSGLLRYDSYQFRRPQPRSEENAERLQGVVNALATDSKGRLWVGLLADGLWRYDPTTGTIVEPEAVEVHERSISFLTPTDEGIWVGVGVDGSLLLLSTDDGHLLRRVKIGTNQSGPVLVRSGAAASDGAFWVAGNKGVFRIAAGTDVAVAVSLDLTGAAMRLMKASNGRLYAACTNGLFEIDDAGGLHLLWQSTAGPVTALAESSPGHLWFAASDRGLMQIDLASTAVTPIQSGGTGLGAMPKVPIHTLWMDRAGLMWVATNSAGFYKVDPTGTRFETIRDSAVDQDAIGRNNFVSVYRSADALWLGTMGDGLRRYDRQSGEWQQYQGEILQALGSDDKYRPLTIRSIADAGNGRLWIASQLGIARLDPSSGVVERLPPLPDVENSAAGTDSGPLLVTRNGNLWAGNRSNRIARFDPESRQWKSIELVPGAAQANVILSLFEDRDGTLWAGSLKGLHRIDVTTGRVRTFQHIAGNPRSMTSNIVRSMHQDADGTLWIGTQSGLNQLERMDASGAEFSSWPDSEQLRDDTIYAILPGPLDRLWVSTNRGLMAIDRKSGIILGSSMRDGLQALEFNGGAAALLADGDLVFGGPNGLNRFSPERIKSSMFVAPVEITEVRIGNREPIQPLRRATVELGDDDSLITIGFAALDYTAPDHNRFQYRLKGYDPEWIDVGFRPVAALSHLKPGSYLFQVRGSNRDGIFGADPAELTIVVPTPWWQSSWAKLGYLCTGLMALLFVLHSIRRRRTDLLRQNAELIERENRLHMAVWGSGDQFWDWDLRRGVLIRTTSDVATGSSVVIEIPIDVWQGQVHAEDIDPLRQRMIDHVDGRTDIYESEHRLRVGDDWRWVLARGRVVERDRSGAATRISGTSRDITLTRLAEQDRRIAIQVLQDMEEAVSVIDLQFHFVSVNPAFSRVTGWADWEVIGQSTRLLDSSRHGSNDYDRVRQTLMNDGSWNGELWQRRSDGTEFSSWTQLNEVRDAGGMRTHYVGVFTDITERKRSEQELRYLANYDTLTGLPNRTLLAQRLSAVLALDAVTPGGLIYLDLDHFKHVNDSYGHAAGDRLLRAAGDRLRQIIDTDDTVARLGGDEFAIILHTISSEAQAAAVARRIIKAFSLPIEIGDAESVIVTTSIGISLFPQHGDNVAELLKFADTAMYQAKSCGRNTFMVYTEDMNTQAHYRASVIAALRKAIARDEFRLVFQPRLSLASNRMCGVEALLRWNSADLGEIGPAEFIPFAEESGLILPIGDWVLRETCAQMARWRSEGVRGLSASINVSMMQLQRGNVAGQLAALLDEFAIPPDQIELELT